MKNKMKNTYLIQSIIIAVSIIIIGCSGGSGGSGNSGSGQSGGSGSSGSGQSGGSGSSGGSGGSESSGSGQSGGSGGSGSSGSGQSGGSGSSGGSGGSESSGSGQSGGSGGSGSSGSGQSGGSEGSGSSGSGQTITPTVESIYIETNGYISELLDGITGITIETDENGNLTTFTSGVTASYDDEFTIITIESNASRTIIKLTGGDAENRMVSKNESLNINNKGEQYILTSTIVDSLKTIVRAIDDDNNYFCPDTSYIPIITQRYLQELPLDVNHCLGKDISLKGNFEPIGYPDNNVAVVQDYLDTNRLNAIFDGNNKKIIGLTINKPDYNYIGLFGYIGESGEVRQLTIEDPNVIGNNHVGALAGENGASIENVTITGGYDLTKTSKVQGNSGVGGLVGSSRGAIKNSRVVSGGNNFKISGIGQVGGLAGFIDFSTIESSYTSIVVEPIDDADISFTHGGLVGVSSFGNIRNSYSTGSVNGHKFIGGIVGSISGGEIINNYSTGKVSFNGNYTEGIGGFIGKIDDSLGLFSSENNYFDTEKSGQSDGIGRGEEVTEITGITATEIESGGSPFIDNNWDFNTVWSVQGDGEWPILQWQEQAD